MLSYIGAARQQIGIYLSVSVSEFKDNVVI